MYPEFVAAMQGVKSLVELLTAAKSLSNHNEILLTATTVRTQLAEAFTTMQSGLQKQASLANRVRELEQQINEFENCENQLKRYELFKFQTGALAYTLKPGHEDGEPTHYLCATCMNKKKKTILQPNGRGLYCVACNTRIVTHPVPQIKPPRARGSLV